MRDKMEIGYLGPSGTFTEQAAYQYCKDAKTVCFQSFSDIFAAVREGRVQYGVAAIENSIEGTVNATMDSLIFDGEVFIKAQLVLPVSQNIMVRPGSAEAKIGRVLSHPHALGQCRRFLDKNYPSATQIPVSSTAEAARMVAESGGAAIANDLAAELYNLEIIGKNIQDEKQNFTTFVIVTKEDTTPPLTGMKTSIAFSTQDKPGALYQVLDIFAIWNINITKIISRPMKGRPGEYVFYADLDGFEDDKDVRDALIMVKRKTSFYKTLGSYPVLGTI